MKDSEDSDGENYYSTQPVSDGPNVIGNAHDLIQESEHYEDSETWKPATIVKTRRMKKA